MNGSSKQYNPVRVNSPGILLDNKVNTIAADVLVLYITRTSATMALTMQQQCLIIFSEEGI